MASKFSYFTDLIIELNKKINGLTKQIKQLESDYLAGNIKLYEYSERRTHLLYQMALRSTDLISACLIDIHGEDKEFISDTKLDELLQQNRDLYMAILG